MRIRWIAGALAAVVVAGVAVLLLAHSDRPAPSPVAASQPPSAQAPTAQPTASIPASTTAPVAPAVPVNQPSASALYSIDHSVPGTHSGPLTGADLPTPAALGAGWASRTDPGNPEDGYQGNGTPNVARNPAEVVGTAVPLGCLLRTSLPLPRWALESDYVHQPDGTYAVVIRMRFASTSAAATFMAGRDHDLLACSTQAAPAGLVQRLQPGTTTTVSVRTDAGSLSDGSAWTEIAHLTGTDVLLAAANTTTASVFSPGAIAPRLG